MDAIQTGMQARRNGVRFAIVLPWALVAVLAPLSAWLAVHRYAPQWLEGASERDLRQVEEVVRTGLKDPDSARFSDVRVSADGKYACGSVNAKNSMGGYVGTVPFLLQRSTGYVELMPNESNSSDSTAKLEAIQRQIKFIEDVQRFCVPPSDK